jgi:hypothetical protein
MEGTSTRLFYSLRFEHILHHFKIGYKLVFVLGIHFDARHWHIHCEPKDTSAAGSRDERWERPIETDGRTIDGVEDLAVDRASPALLDPGIVDLEQLIEPCKEF